MSELDNERHAHERGEIIRVLMADYGQRMTTVVALLRALDALGHSLTPNGLVTHLTMLEEREYVKLWRAKDRPGYRRDRNGTTKPDTVEFCKLTVRGIELLDGRIAEDAMVTF